MLDNATVPYVIDGDGNVHLYVHGDADSSQANRIIINSKVQRPSVCNALETLIINKSYIEKNGLQIINELDHLQINEKILQSKVNSLNSIEPIIIDKSDRIKRKIEEWAAKRVSPTALTTFINCRLQFYFKYIAKIYPQDEIVEFIEANSFGTIIHEALFEAYTPHLHAPLKPQLLDDIKNTTLMAIAEGFQKEVGERMNYGNNHLLYEVAQRLTSNYFAAESRLLSECEKTL